MTYPFTLLLPSSVLLLPIPISITHNLYIYITTSLLRPSPPHTYLYYSQLIHLHYYFPPPSFSSPYLSLLLTTYPFTLLLPSHFYYPQLIHLHYCSPPISITHNLSIYITAPLPFLPPTAYQFTLLPAFLTIYTFFYSLLVEILFSTTY